MLRPEELDAFRSAAYAALGTRELIEYLAQRQLSGEPVNPASVDRAQTAMQPVAKALFAIYKRTGSFPRIRYRGFLFMLTLLPDQVMDLQIVRESDFVEVE
jgi:hypothetical protein